MSNAGAIVAAAKMRQERKLVAELRDRQAFSASAAIPLEPRRHLARGALRRLLRHGAVHQTPTGAFWLDEPAYEAMRARRRRIVLVVLALAALVIVGIVVAFGQR